MWVSLSKFRSAMFPIWSVNWPTGRFGMQPGRTVKAMGYSVQSLDIDFHIPADKVEAALAAVNADPALQRPC